MEHKHRTIYLIHICRLINLVLGVIKPRTPFVYIYFSSYTFGKRYNLSKGKMQEEIIVHIDEMLVDFVQLCSNKT